MPLIKRSIEPVNLSRSAVPQGIQNELEFVTNNTLANVIRQISSLSKYAEDMFGELFNDANSIFRRANGLQERVDKLKVKVTQLDSTVEEVSLQDINLRKPFKSSVTQDKQVISLETRPAAIMEKYRQCEAPPSLRKLNPYREDGKDSMKFYTDSMYFFELWCQEMKKDTEHQKKELRRRRQRRPKTDEQKKKPREIRSKEEIYRDYKLGVELAPEQRPRPDHLGLKTGQNKIQSEDPNVLQNSHQGMIQHNDYQQQPVASYEKSNGPVNATTGYQGGPPSSHVPPNYNQSPYPNHQDPYQDGHYQSQQQMSHYNSPHRTSRPGPGTPSSANRPSQPPPPLPPPNPGSQFNRGNSSSRDSLPPPPPPPPFEMNGARDTPPYNTPSPLSHVRQDSPALSSHSPSPQIDTPERDGLPPPPPPPPLGEVSQPGSIDMMPPPPATPPVPPMMNNAGPAAPPPPPPPPPPPVSTGLRPPGLPNGNLDGQHPDAVSITSNMSSTTVSSASTLKSEEANKAVPPPKEDDRSDLLQAIRTGINLRKVEERRQRDEQKKQPVAGLDVQSIMEAAFEMRRKALEANDESDEEDAEDAWESDED